VELLFYRNTKQSVKLEKNGSIIEGVPHRGKHTQTDRGVRIFTYMNDPLVQMSRRASVFARQNPGRRRVRFPDEIVFQESIKVRVLV
jgi:hypothetical protein